MQLHGRSLSVFFALLLLGGAAHAEVYRYGRFEQTFTAAQEYADPLKDVEVTIAFDGPGNVKDEVRAFWDGGTAWKVRYSPQQTGTFRYKVQSADKSLDGKSGEFKVSEYRGQNALYRAGVPRLSYDRRYLVQADNKPWLYLADTAWNGALLSSPDEWKRYLADRAAKTFTAVQFVMTQWRAGRQDAQGQVAFTGSNPIKINPQFFQRMDEKLNAVNNAGLVGVPVMLWALASKDKESPGVALSTEDATQLARYIAARYAAHQVIWMLGGDGDYTGPNVAKWKSIGEAVFPQGRKRQLVGMHPRGMQAPWADYTKEGWLDIFFYQSGHGDNAAKWQWNATQGPAQGWKLDPPHPVIDAEPNYEGHTSYQSKKTITDAEVRRAAYYSLLAGPPAGVTYGAHGIWFWSRKAEVPLDHPNTGVAKPWTECLNYPGAIQMKVLRQIFDSVEWWRLRPERYLLREDKFDESSYRDFMMPALTDKGDLGMIYLPANPQVRLKLSRFTGAGKVIGTWADPRTGKRTAAGTWGKNESDLLVKTPGDGDWVLILQAKN